MPCVACDNEHTREFLLYFCHGPWWKKKIYNYSLRNVRNNIRFYSETNRTCCGCCANLRKISANSTFKKNTDKSLHLQWGQFCFWIGKEKVLIGSYSRTKIGYIPSHDFYEQFYPNTMNEYFKLLEKNLLQLSKTFNYN